MEAHPGAMNSSCDPEGRAKRRRAVLDHLAGAARTYYLLAELANAAGAPRVARGFVNSAIRITECLRRVDAGDLDLTAALALAIHSLPGTVLRRSDRDHLGGSC